MFRTLDALMLFLSAYLKIEIETTTHVVALKRLSVIQKQESMVKITFKTGWIHTI